MKDGEITISVYHEDGGDHLDIKVSGSANLVLGMIQHGRRVLDELESKVYADIADKSVESK